MDTSHSFGFILVGFSAVLVASHWQQWRVSKARCSADLRQRRFSQRQIRRRMQASGLIGVVGLALVALQLLPRSPLVMSLYLLGLIASACWIATLAMADVWATRNFQHQQHLDQVAGELRATNRAHKP